MFTREYLESARSALIIRYHMHHLRGETSGEAINLIAEHINAIQEKRGEPATLHDENSARFYLSAAEFAQVLENIQLRGVPHLSGMYRMLFPSNKETPRYTQAQIMCLARVLLNPVQRAVLRVVQASPLAPKVEVEAPSLVDQVKAETRSLMDQVLADLAMDEANACGAELDKHTPGENTNEFVRKVRAFGDSLDDLVHVRRRGIDALLDMTFQETDPELKQALMQTFAAADHSPTAPANSEDDYQLAKAIALSQAAANEADAQYQRDIDRAIAESMRQA